MFRYWLILGVGICTALPLAAHASEEEVLKKIAARKVNIQIDALNVTIGDILGLVSAVDEDPDPEVRQWACGMLDAIHVSRHLGPAGTSIFAALADQARSKEPAARRRALLALGWLHAGYDDITKIMIAALTDPDASVRGAAAEAIVGVCENRISENTRQMWLPMLSALKDQFDKDPEARGAVGLAFYILYNPLVPETSPGEASLAKLMKSKDPNDRAIAALLRLDDIGFYRSDECRKLVIDGINSKWPWVRDVSSGMLEQFESGGWPVSKKEVLHEAILDPNPDVATDASLRLAGIIGEQMVARDVFRFHECWKQSPQRRLDPVPAGLAADVAQINNKDKSKRLAAVQHLSARGIAAKGATVAITTVLADSDKDVAAAARRALYTILAPARIPKR